MTKTDGHGQENTRDVLALTFFESIVGKVPESVWNPYASNVSRRFRLLAGQIASTTLIMEIKHNFCQSADTRMTSPETVLQAKT